MSDNKRQLRSMLRGQNCVGDSAALCSRVLVHPWFLEAKSVLGYWAIGTEPVLTPVLEACLSMGKTLALPRCGANGTMTARQVLFLNQLEPGAYGIMEPPENLEVIEPETLDLILTPGMAFSPTGARLGRGKGYYDRFLARTQGKTMGICFESRMFASIPMEEHDRFVDAVLTDKRAILCETEGKVCSKTRGTRI